jgi:hypothetical protein
MVPVFECPVFGQSLYTNVIILSLNYVSVKSSVIRFFSGKWTSGYQMLTVPDLHRSLK